MTVVRCSFQRCIHNEGGKESRCSNQAVELDIIEGSDHFHCADAAIPTKRMEVPTGDLALYPISELSTERGRLIKTLEDDIWSDEDHWWRAQMYARLSQLELFIYFHDELSLI